MRNTYKGQGDRACNSNFQYISDNKNLTPHSGHKKKCNNRTENTEQIIFTGYCKVEIG